MDAETGQPLKMARAKRSNGGRSLVVTLGPFHDKPWWWKHIQSDEELCPLDYERLVYRQKHSQNVSTLELPLVVIMILWRLLRWRRRYDYVFTFECDLVGLSIAFWQSLTGMRRPRQVILQFIMREPDNNLRSRAKYAVMRWLFASVDRVVVSSSAEVGYYQRVFGWREGKAVFVPFHTSPELVDGLPEDGGEDYILAAGRTFRDYATLLQAVSGTGMELIIVGGSGTATDIGEQSNVRVLENIPQGELQALMRRARVIVVPLQDRAISTGQSVLLHAMGLGKPVVATRTAGTVDYIEHGVDGLLVPPANPSALRAALQGLDDSDLRQRLGDAARKRILSSALPQHYTMAVRRACWMGAAALACSASSGQVS